MLGYVRRRIRLSSVTVTATYVTRILTLTDKRQKLRYLVFLQYKMSSESPPKEQTFAEKHSERMKRLRNLHQLRNQARNQNHQEVVAEDARNKLPANWENRKRRAEWILNDQKAREEAAAKGELLVRYCMVL